MLDSRLPNKTVRHNSTGDMSASILISKKKFDFVAGWLASMVSSTGEASQLFYKCVIHIWVDLSQHIYRCLIICAL